MCGIAGIFNKDLKSYNNLSSRLKVMNDLLAHRGPDDENIWIHPKKFIGFAHRRLSIIDLTTGAQPMSDNSGNWIVYNGEIYNYIELRKEIGEQYFKTASDTEVILSAYKKWGKECVKHFRGMFTFVIWDENEKIIFCARDRFGIKPFYYTIVNNT